MWKDLGWLKKNLKTSDANHCLWSVTPAAEKPDFPTWIKSYGFGGIGFWLCCCFSCFRNTRKWKTKALGSTGFACCLQCMRDQTWTAMRRILEFNSHSPFISQEMDTNPNIGYFESVQCEMALFTELPVTSQSAFLALPWDSQPRPIGLSLVSFHLYSSSKPAPSTDPESFPFRTC